MDYTEIILCTAAGCFLYNIIIKSIANMIINRLFGSKEALMNEAEKAIHEKLESRKSFKQKVEDRMREKNA